jgi:phosphoglucosamine mutase
LSQPAMKPIVRQLFGTDGIRGVAGEYPLNPATVFAIGRALGARLAKRYPDTRRAVLIGEDTRAFSDWISNTIALGLIDGGAEAVRAGVLTTPAVAYLTRSHNFAAGIVVSASHNPWMDNGIKIFGANGYKLSDEIEHEIEQEIFAHIEELNSATAPVDSTQVVSRSNSLRSDFIQWLQSNVDVSALSQLKVVVDCANGAASAIAPELFSCCNLKAEFLHIAPNGRNINERCGALHPDHVASHVAKSASDLGISFDGDADRALFADANGNVINGDAVLLIAARDMKARGTLRNDTVVATTMSNMGLEKALRDFGIKMLRAPVGDKYVLEQMLSTGATLGGEQSGHILFLDGEATTGDGLLTAFRVLDIMGRTGKSLDQLLSDFKVFPQRIKNVRVREKKAFDQVPEIAAAIRYAESELDGNGRVVVRYSGTEKLARVMVEAESEELMNRHTDAIAAAIQTSLGE